MICPNCKRNTYEVINRISHQRSNGKEVIIITCRCKKCGYTNTKEVFKSESLPQK